MDNFFFQFKKLPTQRLIDTASCLTIFSVYFRCCLPTGDFLSQRDLLWRWVGDFRIERKNYPFFLFQSGLQGTRQAQQSRFMVPSLLQNTKLSSRITCYLLLRIQWFLTGRYRMKMTSSTRFSLICGVVKNLLDGRNSAVVFLWQFFVVNLVQALIVQHQFHCNYCRCDKRRSDLL